MSDVKVVPTENGPYKVSGTIELLDTDGNPIPVKGDPLFLCRCGGSANKPFCDGTHTKIGFQDTTPAAGPAEHVI